MPYPKPCPYEKIIITYAGIFRLPWKLIKAQCWQESEFNPNAKSKAGAQGLMQLMPKTDLAIDGDMDAFNPEGNIKDGIKYDREQFDHMAEIPDVCERLKFMLACYNVGRGYINCTMEIAYPHEMGKAMPKGHIGAEPGLWQTWEFTKQYLSHASCVDKNGNHPDHKQVIDYVHKIWANFIPDVFGMEE